MKTAIDWSGHPEPWRPIGPEFKAEVERIAEHPNPAAMPLKIGQLPPAPRNPPR